MLATTVLQTCIRYQSRAKTCQFCAIGQSLAAGRTIVSAAEQAGVSRATVAWHMRSIYEKLQVHSKSEAVAKALRARMIR